MTEFSYEDAEAGNCSRTHIFPLFHLSSRLSYRKVDGWKRSGLMQGVTITTFARE